MKYWQWGDHCNAKTPHSLYYTKSSYKTNHKRTNPESKNTIKKTPIKHTHTKHLPTPSTSSFLVKYVFPVLSTPTLVRLPNNPEIFPSSLRIFFFFFLLLQFYLFWIDFNCIAVRASSLEQSDVGNWNYRNLEYEICFYSALVLSGSVSERNIKRWKMRIDIIIYQTRP